MTTIVLFQRPSLAIIGDTATEVLDAAEGVVRDRISQGQDLLVDDCVCLNEKPTEHLQKRLERLRQGAATESVMGSGFSNKWH